MCMIKKYHVGIIAFVLANSAVPDEMSHSVAFHLGLHSLPKDLHRTDPDDMSHSVAFHQGLIFCQRTCLGVSSTQCLNNF